MGAVRFLLAFAVFNSHFPVVDWAIVGGHEAVLAFFAISGFYMALILDTSYGSARTFYMSRFLSLYPMYALALALSVALLVSLDIHPMTSLGRMTSLMSDPAGFIVMVWSSLCVVGQELLFSLVLSPDGMHFASASRDAIWINSPLIQAWSLSLEMVFYILAPVLVTLKTRTLAGLAVLSLIGKFIVMSGDLANVVFYKRFFPVEFWLFACGILSYRLFKALPEKPRAYDYMAFGVLVTVILMVGMVPDMMKSFALPLAVLFLLPFVFRGFHLFSLDRTVGRIAYPFYLFHFSVIAVFETYMDEPSGWAILGVVSMVSVLAHALFSSGIGRLKRSMRKNRETATLCPSPAFDNALKE